MSTIGALIQDPPAPSKASPTIEIVVPVYNEEPTLRANIETLVTTLRAALPYRFVVTIADNASIDGTPAAGRDLCGRYPEVRYRRLERKGRGLALKETWLASDAEVVAYMDVDLSTNLEGFLPLVAPLLQRQSDVAIGTRLAHSSRVRRRLKREVLSRGYNALVRLLFRSRFSDAQCGFKALRLEAARQLVPHVLDNGWFFDTELLLLAERSGLRIHEVPVDWIEDLDSRVELIPTIAADLAGLARLRLASWRGAGLVVPPARGEVVR